MDSNAHPWFATARLQRTDIEDIKRSLHSSTISPAAVRLVALHHHLIPLPYASDRGFTNQDVLLILRNASSVLSCTQEVYTDLILHGHRHKAAFLRFTNLDYSDFRALPLTMLAAGSATLGGPEGANFNLIRIRSNCSVNIERHFYPPDIDRPRAPLKNELLSYNERKQRFFKRYNYTQQLEIDQVEVRLTIDRQGSSQYVTQVATY